MTAKLLEEYKIFKGYINKHRNYIDHELRCVYGVQYPVDDVDRINLVLHDSNIRAQAVSEVRG